MTLTDQVQYMCKHDNLFSQVYNHPHELIVDSRILCNCGCHRHVSRLQPDSANNRVHHHPTTQSGS